MVSMKRASISDDGISGNWISMMRRVMAMAKIPSADAISASLLTLC